MMKPFLTLTIFFLFSLPWSSANSQTLVQKGSNLCLNAKHSKSVQCLDLKKSPIAIEYIRGVFRIFAVPGKPVGAPPKGIFESKSNFLLPPQATISLKGTIFMILNAKRQRVFELPFIPGTRGIFQYEKQSGLIAFYSEDCLELEPITVREGEVFYGETKGASSIYLTLVERDDIRTKLICKEGIGISCIEDNIIDPRLMEIDLNLEEAFETPFPVGFPAEGLTLPGGDPRLTAATNSEPICKECEEVTSTEWIEVCEFDLTKKGLYKDCDGHLLVVDLASGTVCMDVNLDATATRIEAGEGQTVRLSLPASEISGGEGCCPEQ